jgi:SAM-dependent methyltransferase
LGAPEKYRFVAADIYRLPFFAGVFDGATMIRTLHHMADARLALGQVRRVLQPCATFILEYANKRNLKAIARYLLKWQKWSPFTREPVEYLPLNFDFHPATIREWMNAAGFRTQRTLTVSHLRMGLLKRLLPTKILVALDSLFSLTGNWWQLTPSVFLKSKADEGGERAPQGAFFICPACQTPLEDTPPLLKCGNCGREYPVIDGIYDMRIDAPSGGD